MPLFSQRAGHTPLKKDIQTETVDEALCNGLWSALQLCYWKHWEPEQYGVQPPIAKAIETLAMQLWLHHFKLPIDSLPEVNSYRSSECDVIGIARNHFFKCKWFEVYDFIEFVAANGPAESLKMFTRLCNDFLESENSAYRLVNGEITRITSETELREIEEATGSQYSPVNEHLATALHLLSDRKKPDYRNSVKESISAVEALCNILTGDAKATLGQAIKQFQRDLHPAFVQAISNLYGYTSDENGIRHAMLDKPSVTFADAKFMLVACSALVNYLITKQTEKK